MVMVCGSCAADTVVHVRSIATEPLSTCLLVPGARPFT